jgi:D-sedoheptulose 7-phosphate isomerase
MILRMLCVISLKLVGVNDYGLGILTQTGLVFFPMNAEKIEIIRKSFQESFESMKRTAESPALLEQLYKASEAIKAAYLNDGCLFVAGNGGSAADAQHLCAELVAKLCRDRSSIRAFAMSVDTSLLTAMGNDYGYEYVFSRQVEGLMRKNDIFLGITTSGNSKNIMRALERCRERGITSILLTGDTGGKGRELASMMINVPCDDTRLIQESHLAIYHTLCYLLETDLVAAGVCEYRSAGRPPVL